MSQLVIISSQNPNRHGLVLEAIEAALSASNLGIDVIFILSGQGVYQLLENNQSESLSYPSVIKKLKLLSLYEIDKIFITDIPQNIVEKELSSEVKFEQIQKQQLLELSDEAKNVLYF